MSSTFPGHRPVTHTDSVRNSDPTSSGPRPESPVVPLYDLRVVDEETPSPRLVSSLYQPEPETTPPETTTQSPVPRSSGHSSESGPLRPYGPPSLLDSGTPSARSQTATPPRVPDPLRVSWAVTYPTRLSQPPPIPCLCRRRTYYFSPPTTGVDGPFPDPTPP